jgi:hypothetical protein
MEWNMHVLVVFESMWGNTRAVAEAVRRGMDEEAEVIDVEQAPSSLPADVDLLVVGGPTHAFSMSRPATRHDAVQRGASEGHETRGIREWLDAMPPSGRIDVATFDTRVLKMKKLPGSAAKAAGKDIRRHHLGDLVATESFYVDDTEGPLAEGELARAEAWGAELAALRPRAPEGLG